MTVRCICRREVDLIQHDASAEAAAQRMTARNVGTLIVLDGRKRVAGIVTDRDLALRVVGEGRDPRSARVADVMTAHPVTVHERAPVEDVLAMMRSRGVHRLPVVDADDRLVGVVTADDVLIFLAQELGELGRLIEHSSPQVLAHCQPWSE